MPDSVRNLLILLVRVTGTILTAAVVAATALSLWRLPPALDLCVAASVAAGWTCWLDHQEG